MFKMELKLWFCAQTVSSLYILIYFSLLSNFHSALTTWSTHGFSLMRRCNVLMQTIPARILYPLQTIPIHVPANFFNSLQSILNKFARSSKPARIKHSIICRPNTHGGMALTCQTTYPLHHCPNLKTLLFHYSLLWTTQTSPLLSKINLCASWLSIINIYRFMFSKAWPGLKLTKCWQINPFSLWYICKFSKSYIFYTP